MTIYDVAKRFIDVVVSLVILLLLAPLFILVAVLIKFDDGGRIVYYHYRLGRGRKNFKLFKFRSMVEDADDILFSDPNFLEKLRSGSHKLINDPRITRVGKFIRKYSLDELPQFINVLKGEMSIVGPRAYRPDELQKFEAESPQTAKYIELILSVKPGITGLWQVGGRSSVSFDRRVQLEVFYAENRSLKLDFIIMLKTPFAILRGDGL